MDWYGVLEYEARMLHEFLMSGTLKAAKKNS